jgi:hypothetical protein
LILIFAAQKHGPWAAIRPKIINIGKDRYLGQPITIGQVMSQHYIISSFPDYSRNFLHPFFVPERSRD